MSIINKTYFSRVYKEFTYKNSSNNLYVMIVLFLANLILIGIFGVVGGIGYANEKIKLNSEMSTIVNDMQVKITQLDEAKVTYNEAEPYATKLNALITNTPDMPSYLLQVQDVLTQSGYILVKFVPEVALKNDNTGAITVSVIATGDSTKLGSLIAALESLPRFTKVTNASATFSPIEITLGTLRLSLVVYRSVIL